MGQHRRGGGWGCTEEGVGGAAQQRGAGLYSREGRWGSTEERVGGAAQKRGWVRLHSREGERGCTAGKVGGAAQQGGKVGGVPPLLSRWPFPLPRLHPPLSMPSCPQIPSSTPTSSPYFIFLFADFDHWTGSLLNISTS